MHNESINTYAKNPVRASTTFRYLSPSTVSSSLQKPSVYFIKRNLFPPVEMHYNTNSYPPRKRYIKFSSNPDADCECVAQGSQGRGAGGCGLHYVPNGREGGREGCLFVCFARRIPRDGYIL